jgi:hypothetical protein
VADKRKRFLITYVVGALVLQRLACGVTDKTELYFAISTARRHAV